MRHGHRADLPPAPQVAEDLIGQVARLDMLDDVSVLPQALA